MDMNPGAIDEEGPAPGLIDAADAIRRGGRIGKLRRGLVASILTLGGLTALVEVSLRVTGFRQNYFESTVNKTNQRWVDLTTARIFEERDDNRRPYGMRAGSSCEIDGWSFEITSHKSRGADFPLEKAPNEKRIVCIGDSFSFGLWCDDDETLVGHLARMANEAEPGPTEWRAIDLGVPGYHAGQQALSLEEEGLPLSPDLVVWYFNTNDIEQDGFFYDEELGVLRRDFIPLPTGLRRALWSSHLYGWIATRHRQAVEAAEPGEPPPHLNPRVPYAFVREDNQAATRAAMERVAELCAERNIPLFFVHQPHLTWQGEIQNPDWPMLELVQWVEDVRAELGIEGTNLLGLFRGYLDGVDRLGEGAPSEFLLDTYVADERIQAAVAWMRARANESGQDWNTLDVPARLALLAGYPGTMPATPDFHLTGEGYGYLARVAYAAMRDADMLP